uniref:MAK10-like protein n=1 Tax=Tanacetum cinerariifolium TaxID=118510 RepID=A0A6L2N494_TANCI|nr:hypothetical protein [Tanacetum cinerariifolium]
MGDENPIRTLEDYSKPSHEGYRITIELPEWNIVDPSSHGRILLLVSFLNSFHQEGLQNFKMTSLCSNNIKESLSLKHGLVLRTYSIKSLIMASIFGSKSKSFMTMSISSQDEPSVNRPVSLEIGKNGSAFIQSEMPKRMEDPGLFTLPCRLGDSKPFDTFTDLGSCANIILIYLFKNLNIGLLEEIDHVFGLADGTKSYPIRIVRDVEVHIGRLKLLNNFYIIDMKKDPETPLQVERGFLATANAVIDYKKTKIAIGEGITRDEAWHAKIRLIDPNGEEFTKTLQSIPTSRELLEKESPREIINLDHFYDT